MASIIDQKFIAPVGTTLDRFIAQKQMMFDYATGELSQLLRDIALASKIINKEINRAGLIGIKGPMGEINAQGEEQQKLDVIADVRFTRAFQRGGEVCGIISEEVEGIVDTGNHRGKYVVAIDPLDGSSNIDAAIPLGTIFSIFRRKSPRGGPPTMEDVLQSGSEQVVAGYILYGSSTMLVYTAGYGVHGFTYDGSLGEYFLSHPDMTISTEGKTYSINEGMSELYQFPTREYLTYCKRQDYSARYIGSLVADFHRNLIKGGIFIYPATKKATGGKLRLMFECNPLAFVIEQAGGVATDGFNRILDIKPQAIHQRTPLYIGSKEMVHKAMSYLQ